MLFLLLYIIYISFKVCHMNGIREWFGTVFYGWPFSDDKWQSWELFKSLKGDDSKPWVLFGDLNEILFLSEKCGGQRAV